jgi:anti-sigma regulatory factor (Ser/Thr protein kinase)
VDEEHQGMMVSLLQAGTYACLGTPLQVGDFAYNLSKIIANNTETYNPFAMKYEERILIMPNDFSLVMQVAKNLVDGTLPINEKNRYHIILGLSEIVNNAIEHGNLGITFEEKSDALKASRFYPLAIERAHKEPYKDRVVTIRSRVFPSLRRIEYFVADQGGGFDWRSLPDPKDKENILNRNGRGIMMARYAFDEMIYNETGNEVTLVVNLDLPYRGRRT